LLKTTFGIHKNIH